MKRILMLIAVATTLTFCNTPEPTTTTSNMDTMSNSANMSSTSDTSGMMKKDTGTMRSDSIR
jgi:hypothetical protein